MNGPLPYSSVKRQTWTTGKNLLLCFGCPFWKLVAFPPCPLESPDCSGQTLSLSLIQYNSSTCYPSVLQRWLPWCPAFASSPACREGTVRCLCWSRSTFSIPACVPFPAAFLWLHFTYLISGYRPWCLHSLESPSAEGLSSDMISQADSLRQLAIYIRTGILQRPSFWDLLCSAALSLSSAIGAPAQKNPETQKNSQLHHSDEISLGLVLTTTAQIFYFLEIQERKSIRQEDQKPIVLNCPFSWIYPAF